METYSDGTKILTFDQAIARLSKDDESEKISVPELIVALIGSGGTLYGNLRLQKELFIAIKERIPEDMEIEDPKFVPYLAGPYSFRIASMMEGLVIGGYVKTFGKKGSNKQGYDLTMKGRKFFRNVHKKSPNLVKILSKLREDMDEFKPYGILRYVYNNPDYKHFISESRYKEKYKDITWGKGRG